MRISLAQINPTVGDLDGNARKIISYIRKARRRGSEVVVFPELAVTGYPPEDLLLKPHFINDNLLALSRIQRSTNGILAIVGFVHRGEGIYNSAAIMSDGRIADVYHKQILPNYGVFDEYRYFLPGRRNPLYLFRNRALAINICEDIWRDEGPAKVQALAGADLIININASPYHMGKVLFREDTVLRRVEECGTPIVYVNMVGGQDELVFDGFSFAVDAEGKILVRGKQFEEDLVTFDLDTGKTGRKIIRNAAEKELKKLLRRSAPTEKIRIPSGPERGGKSALRKRRVASLPRLEKVYKALLLGTGDYVAKNGFQGVIVGISGGVDSSLVTTLAVDALGKDYVLGLFMPSRYTSVESSEDAHLLADNLGIKVQSVPIDKIFDVYLKTLAGSISGPGVDVAKENLQARIRGNILMAFSNASGWLVLTTGNKSEMSVGYATLYGDMAGGFAVIKDVPKTLVYELCTWINDRKGRAVIPERVLWKEPSAELKPDQKDTDALPPYPVLDPILKSYVEEDRSFEEITGMGCDIECTQKVIQMIDLSEYKRRQAPPGIKITPRAFGKDRRFPITNRYKSF
jgi:NAD+ synthase (glutamine-hydrolysing)